MIAVNCRLRQFVKWPEYLDFFVFVAVVAVKSKEK